jgi:hypothetical protein
VSFISAEYLFSRILILRIIFWNPFKFYVNGIFATVRHLAKLTGTFLVSNTEISQIYSIYLTHGILELASFSLDYGI